jgi:surfactin synthase thioesterase subunit
MKVYFSHGKESGPWGSKIKRLASIAKEHDCSVESIDYSDILDPDLRVERLISVLKDEEDEFLLVGSSMGGYVSVVAAEQVDTKGVFLLAPALFVSGYKKQSYESKAYIEVVHGWSDDVIPPESSIKFAKNMNCSLHLIAGDHRLNSSIEVVEKLFSQFIASRISG